MLCTRKSNLSWPAERKNTESPAPIKRKRETTAKLKAAKRAAESPDATKKRREREAKRIAAKRAAQSPDEIRKRRETEAKRIAAKRAAESPAQIEKRRQDQARRQAASRAVASPAEIRTRREKQAKQMANKRAAMKNDNSPAETQLRQRQNRKAKHLAVKFCQEIISMENLLTLTSDKKVDELETEELEIRDEDSRENGFSSGSSAIESDKSVFPCSECDFVFVQKEQLDDHISSLHVKKESETSFDEVIETEDRIVETDSDLEVKPHVCKICFKDFDQISSLKDHICSENLSTNKELSSDLQKGKTSRKTLFSCPICEQSFACSKSLGKHKLVHSGGNSYECEVCQMKFSRKHFLKCHKLIHTGEKPQECDICKRKFPDLGHLKRHYRRHTGEKPHKCEVCKSKNKFLAVISTT